MLVSFIIPSYNSAHTVKRCLDSIYALPLKQSEFEVIFVDDCSTDNTIDIVQNYCPNTQESKSGKVDNLILLHQPQNNRQGAARNRGISIAKGEYICLVDSDDAVADGIVSAIQLAKELKTDMVAFHFASANEHGQITGEKEHLSFAPKQIFSGIEMQLTHSYWCSGPVAYLYSKAFLDQSNYPFYEGVLYEDSDFVSAHLYYAQRMAYSSEIGYIVHYREGSTTHSNNYKNNSDYLLLGTRMLVLYNIIQQDIAQQKRMDDGICKFADDVLEGACWNVTKSLKRLYKLPNGKEIVSFYKRVDAFVDRHKLYADPLMHKFSYSHLWNTWSAFCMKHKYLSIVVNTMLSWAYKTLKNVKHKS